MSSDTEHPKIYSVSQENREKVLGTAGYLYSLWAVMLLQLTAEGHMDDELTDLFDRELLKAVFVLADIKSTFLKEELPF